MKPTKAQLALENSELKAEVKRLSERATMIARWILAERAKMLVGMTSEDYRHGEKSPLPVVLWMCAQELVGDQEARLAAHDITNKQRKKMGMMERPMGDDPWIMQKR